MGAFICCHYTVIHWIYHISKLLLKIEPKSLRIRKELIPYLHRIGKFNVLNFPNMFLTKSSSDPLFKGIQGRSRPFPTCHYYGNSLIHPYPKQFKNPFQHDRRWRHDGHRFGTPWGPDQIQGHGPQIDQQCQETVDRQSLFLQVGAELHLGFFRYNPLYRRWWPPHFCPFRIIILIEEGEPVAGACSIQGNRPACTRTHAPGHGFRYGQKPAGHQAKSWWSVRPAWTWKGTCRPQPCHWT